MAAFPATAVSSAQSPTSVTIRASVAVYQEWLGRSVIVALTASTRSRTGAAHVSSNRRPSQGLPGISFGNVFDMKLWQRSGFSGDYLQKSPNTLINLGNNPVL